MAMSGVAAPLVGLASEGEHPCKSVVGVCHAQIVRQAVCRNAVQCAKKVQMKERRRVQCSEIPAPGGGVQQRGKGLRSVNLFNSSELRYRNARAS